MKQKLLFLLLLVTISNHSFSQIANPASDLMVCDDSIDDGFTFFDLTINDQQILGDQNINDFLVSYYETFSNAQNNVNPITNPTAYNNIVSDSQTIYAALTENSSGNFDITSFNINVLATPSPGIAEDLELCDEITQGSMTAVFDLTQNDLFIVNGQSGISISYYISLSDAESGANMIPNPMNFTNTSSPQTIYARVESLMTGCFAITNFNLIVNPSPSIDLEAEYFLCNGETLTIDTGLEATTNSFEWSFEGVVIPSETSSSLIVNQSGIYSVLVINLNGCGSATDETLVTTIDCTDTDDDGVIDGDEDLNGNGNLDDDDTDGDGIPNYLDSDDDGDNVDTIIEINIILGRSANALHPFVDTDGDLIENYLDDDDDGDGVLTVDEDYNNNGDPTDDDTDISGIPDYLESNVALNLNEFMTKEFKMYPNPANFSVMINLEHAKECSVSIIDIQGKTILTKSFSNTNKLEMNISALESGLYFVKLKNGSNEITRKLIIN